MNDDSVLVNSFRDKNAVDVICPVKLLLINMLMELQSDKSYFFKFLYRTSPIIMRLKIMTIASSRQKSGFRCRVNNYSDQQFQSYILSYILSCIHISVHASHILVHPDHFQMSQERIEIMPYKLQLRILASSRLAGGKPH